MMEDVLAIGDAELVHDYLAPASDIGKVRVRDDRVLLHLDPPMHATSYLVFSSKSDNKALTVFKRFITDHYAGETTVRYGD